MLVNQYNIGKIKADQIKEAWAGKYEIENLRQGGSFKDQILKFDAELDPLPTDEEMIIICNGFMPAGLGGKVERSGFNQFWVTVYTD